VSAATPPIRIASAGELLAVVPYLLGHEPAESLVVIGVSGQKIQFSARADLDAPVEEVAIRVRRALSEPPLGMELLIIGYTESGSECAIRELAAGLFRHGIAIVLRVTKGRFYCLSCEGCTPPEGTPIDTATPAAAELILQGIAPLASRGAIDEMVAAASGNHASQMMRAFQRAARRLTRRRFRESEAQAAIEQAFDQAQQAVPLADDDAAWLCLVLHDLPVRDIAWRATDTAQWQFDLWLDLTRRCLPAAVAPVASLLAWSAWRRGDGAVAAAALSRALAVEPDYRLANMIATALEYAMPTSSIGHWPPEDADLQRT
jgi:hypothetical protein